MIMPYLDNLVFFIGLVFGCLILTVIICIVKLSKVNQSELDLEKKILRLSAENHKLADENLELLDDNILIRKKYIKALECLEDFANYMDKDMYEDILRAHNYSSEESEVE